MFEAGLDRKQKELQSLNERTIALVHEIAERQTEHDRKRGQVGKPGGAVRARRRGNRGRTPRKSSGWSSRLRR